MNLKQFGPVTVTATVLSTVVFGPTYCFLVTLTAVSHGLCWPVIGQMHAACRGALNVVAKARCQEGVRGSLILGTFE